MSTAFQYSRTAEVLGMHCDEQILMIPFFLARSHSPLHCITVKSCTTLLYFANTLAFTICIRGSGLFWCKGDELKLLTSYSPRARDLSGSVGIAVHIFGQHTPGFILIDIWSDLAGLSNEVIYIATRHHPE